MFALRSCKISPNIFISQHLVEYFADIPQFLARELFTLLSLHSFSTIIGKLPGKKVVLKNFVYIPS